ncbi:hypothetical protein N7528_003468 [Penicillium herquei]|nr:hypothetical protein N7528_003468 [Penicillium herquei]
MCLPKRVEEPQPNNQNSSCNTGCTTNNGQHSSSLANRLDPRVDSTQASSTHAHSPGGTTGPRDSNMANQLNPPGNSNKIHWVPARHIASSAEPTSTAILPDHYTDYPSAFGYGHDPAYNKLISRKIASGSIRVAMPRCQALNSAEADKLDLANKLDPCIDSNLDTHATHGGQFFSTDPISTTPGPHNSNLVNKVDTRIGSDMDNRAHHQDTAGSNCGSPTIGDAPGITSDNMTDKVADPCVGAIPKDRISGTGHQRTC